MNLPKTAMTPWILVVDDDANTREALAGILTRAGYRVASWAGDESLEAAGLSQPYQVAVIDYHLPGANGLEVAQRLKQMQPDCRIILVSAHLPNLAGTTEGASLVDRFLAKPFSKDTILEVIAQFWSPGEV